MAFTVLITNSAASVRDKLKKVERQKYDAAVGALRGEGCKAGGKRLLAGGGSDYALCQRSLYGAWRMTTAYSGDTVVIVSLAKHEPGSNPNETLAEVFPGLSATERRRSDQPPCCDDPAMPPMSDEVAECSTRSSGPDRGGTDRVANRGIRICDRCRRTKPRSLSISVANPTISILSPPSRLHVSANDLIATHPPFQLPMS